MVSRSKVEGYEEFWKLMETLEKEKKQIYVMFSGSKDSSGNSWCPDCVKAMPVVEKILEDTKDSDIHFVYAEVGERSFWKDPNCPFRTDKRLLLKCVPTLMKWGHPDKLEDNECSNPDLVSMIFE